MIRKQQTVSRQRLFAALLILFSVEVRAEEINWQRCCIDGVELSGNSDVGYLGGPPRVRVSVPGRTAEEAASLVDAEGSGRTSVSWNASEDVRVDIDLTAERLILGVVAVGSGLPGIQITTSSDRQNWHRIPDDNVVEVNPHTLMASSLAVTARYLRVTAPARHGPLNIREIYVYGEKDAQANSVGGIYTSWFPPVAGHQVTLRSIVRNTSDRPAGPVIVDFHGGLGPKTLLGSELIDEIPPYSARVASVNWIPQITEPHEITVRMTGAAFDEASRSESIPVVNRRLYFANYHPIDNERLTYANLYTTVGGSFEFYLAKIRGRLGLFPGSGPHTTGEIGTEGFVRTWRDTLHGPLRDGIAMDEWSEPSEQACEALEVVSRAKGKRLLVPWVIGPSNAVHARCFRFADLLLPEVYFNYWGHHSYRRGLDSYIDSAKQHGLTDKYVIALGTVARGRPSTPAQIEREVRYLRRQAPEMPGVAFYGYRRTDLARLNDQLCYKYFIAPVIIVEKTVEGAEGTMDLTVRNIGGMTARDVTVALVDRNNLRLLTTATVSVLQPCKAACISIECDSPAVDVLPRIVPHEFCTELNPVEPLEIYPDVQVTGLPICICWTPEQSNDTSAADDYLDVINVETRKIARRIDSPAEKGDWLQGHLYLDSDEVTSLAPGHYELRLIDGTTDRIRGREELTILDSVGKLFVSSINDKPLARESNEITIEPGDTFEINWDLRDCSLPHPEIYISSPDDDLQMPREDGSYAVFRPGLLGTRINAPTSEPERLGSWVWRSRVGRRDVLPPPGEEPTSWIVYSGGLGRHFHRVNMAAKPGKWRLWIGGSSPKVPVSPVVTVNVQGSGPTVETECSEIPIRLARHAQLDITVDSPQKMTTGDMVVVSVRATIKDSPRSYLDHISLFRTHFSSDGITTSPGLLLESVTNYDRRTREFTASFMINSPEPGPHHYVAVVNSDDNAISFTIDVTPKVVVVGSDDTISVATCVPSGIVDSGNYVDRFELHTYEGIPEFGTEESSEVRILKNGSDSELGRKRGRSVSGRILNPDKMSDRFEARIPVGSIEEIGTKYYLIWHGYVGPSYWHLIRIDHVHQLP